MADAVSKLYAEIGFKVNQDGLKQAQELLKGLAAQMTALNNATKEAAKQYGVFSKNQSKQSLNDAKVATEASKQALNQKRIQILGIKELNRQEDRLKREQEAERKKAHKERIAADKLIAKHEEEQNKQAEKNAEMRTSRLKGMAGAFKTFAISVSTALVGLAAGAIGISGESRKRALNIRDFQFETGVGFEDLQKYRRQFNIIGSRLGAEDIMSDLASVQQNLMDISLGKGNLSGYKLTGVRAAADAGRGSPVRVMEELRKVAADSSITNAMLVNVMKDMGIKNAGQWLMNFRNVRGEDARSRATQLTSEQETQILLAELELRRLSFAVSNLKDQISSLLAPYIEDVAKWLKTGTEDLSLFFKKIQEGKENVGVWTQTISGGIQLFKDLCTALGAVIKVLGTFYTALATFAQKAGETIGDWIAEKLGFNKSYAEHAERREEWMKNLIEAEKSGKLKSMKEGEDEFEANVLFGKSVKEAKDLMEYRKRYQAGGDAVSQFNNDRRIGNNINFTATDNSVQNVTINANGEDEFIEKVAETVEEKQKKKEIRQSEYNWMNDIFVMGGSSGNASVGVQ